MRAQSDCSGSLSALSGMARMADADLYARLNSGVEGLESTRAQKRLRADGPNRIAEETQYSLIREIWRRLRTPLNGLLFGLAITSWLLSDVRSAIVIAVMVVLSVGLGFIQEHRSSQAAARLKQMVQVHASVRRLGAAGVDTDGFSQIPLEDVVAGVSEICFLDGIQGRLLYRGHRRAPARMGHQQDQDADDGNHQRDRA